MLTLQAILVPITASRTSNLLRAIATLFGVQIGQSPYYAFMASVKLRWAGVWEVLWRAIPEPLTDGRLLLALDDSINPKTGRKVFACQTTFDHAAKTNQSQYPWAQTIVTVGLLKQIHGRWSCLPLAFAFYFRLQTLAARCIRVRGEAVVFQTKFAQAVRLISDLAQVFPNTPILVAADSWFGNKGLLQPLRAALGPRAHLLSRLRAYTLNLYGGVREVMAVDRLVMLKTLHCPVRVVWVFRKTQWIALVTTDLALTVAQIIEFYGARWKIEAGFREIKQEIGSAETQTRNPDAVTNHLNFCMAAATITWIYGAHLDKAPARRYATAKRTEYAFADLRRALAKDLGGQGFGIDCEIPDKAPRNPLIGMVMDLVA